MSLPTYEDEGEILRFLMKENVPAPSLHRRRVRLQARGRRPDPDMFAGEGDAFRTNRRFQKVSRACPRIASPPPSTRSRCTVATRTASGHLRQIGNSGVSIATLDDDMKVLYDGFDLVNPTTSVSMTINGPAPIIPAILLQHRPRPADRQVQGRTAATHRRGIPEDPRMPVLATVRGTGAGRHP